MKDKNHEAKEVSRRKGGAGKSPRGDRMRKTSTGEGKQQQAARRERDKAKGMTWGCLAVTDAQTLNRDLPLLTVYLLLVWLPLTYFYFLLVKCVVLHV